MLYDSIFYKILKNNQFLKAKSMRIIKNMLYNLMLKERCPDRLALSLSLGVYIAFCPFVGLHTVLVFAFAWLLSLNALLLLAISNGINNPLTMLPIYASGHMTGNWLLQSLCGYDASRLDPSWMQWFNMRVVETIGIPKLSLTAFMIGGNLLGLLIAIFLYPITQTIFRTIGLKVKKVKRRYCSSRGKKNETHNNQ